jgi:hypothetical protein
MDLPQLKQLGEVAGIGGIALGAITILMRNLIGSIAGIPKQDRARVVTFIAAGCFAIGALGIAAWAFGNQPPQPTASTIGGQSPAIVSKGDASVSYGTPAVSPQSPPTTPAVPEKTSLGGTANTQGSQSPAIAGAGNVTVQYGSPPPTAAPSPK